LGAARRPANQNTSCHGPAVLQSNPPLTPPNGRGIAHFTLDLGPFAPEGLRNGRPRPFLAELYPQCRLPKQYLDLIDRQWLTEDGQLFAATPGGDFATTLEGYRLRLPLAVMPPAAYERWLARGGSHRRRRKRRKGLRAPRGRAGACRCAITTPNLSTLTTAAKAKQPFFLRN
jgi:hypothetical protein